jgi:hypothetical protein
VKVAMIAVKPRWADDMNEQPDRASRAMRSDPSTQRKTDEKLDPLGPRRGVQGDRPDNGKGCPEP